ncbi:three prime repair exonuclease 2-like [Ptychodera flava]|uniref:three prime repair exonuclease 2-like n=1 Tax=Ptychodera flava TaxID=63121 RepID=UPI00396A0B6D
MFRRRRDSTSSEDSFDAAERIAGLDLSSRVRRTGASLQIQTFVFIDLEATGLPDSMGNMPDMTELAMVAISRKFIEESASDGQIPRVKDKITLCLRPEKTLSSNAERLSGLSKPMLEKYDKKPMNSDVVGAVRYFLRRQAGPVCLVSHAGEMLDFPVLRRELAKAGGSWDTVYTADSLKFFQDHLPRQQKKTLQSLCQRYLRFEPTHDAESDAIGLLRLLTSPTFSQKFLDWAQRKKRQF